MGQKIKTKELLDFTSNLSLLLQSGLSLQNSIEMINSFSRNRKIQSLTDTILTGLRKGNSFSKLISKMELGFSPLYKGLVDIGDRIGSLNTILPTLQSYLERNKKIRDKIINAALYPSMVLAMLVVGVIVLITVVFPKLITLFTDIGNSEGQIDQIKHNIIIFETAGLILMLIIVLIVLFTLLSRNIHRIKVVYDSIIIKIPVLRNIISSYEMFNYTFAVETLTRHGIPLSSAVEESLNVCNNEIIISELKESNRELSSGRGLYNAFKNRKHLPDRFKQWIGIGENTGQTDKVFNQLRIYYEAEIDNLTTRILGIIEPALIIFVGIVVILLILTFIVPMFSLFGTII